MRIFLFLLAMLLVGIGGNTANANPYEGDDNISAVFFAKDKPTETLASTSKKAAKRTVETVHVNIQRGADLIGKASRYMGANARQLGLPSRLWCADFMNMLVGGEDRRAISYASRGKPAGYGCVNCIAVTKRRGGNHVGVVKGYDENGNPIIISGNHNRKVGVGIYAKNRVVAYRYI